MKRIGQKEYMTKNSKVIKSIIALKVETMYVHNFYELKTFPF
jgi:hypothetical protein